MNIKLKEQIIVSQEMERQFKLDINGKEILVSRWQITNEFETDGAIEIFKGKELLTKEEQEEVFNFVDEQN